MSSEIHAQSGQHARGMASDGAAARSLGLVALADKLLFAAFLLVVAMSPFEAGYPPLTRFLNATFTNLELTLLALTAALLFKLVVDPVSRARLMRMPLLFPILVLVTASVLSSVFGEYQAGGINFTYRLLMGVVVFASAYEAIRSSRRLLAAVFTLLGVAIISAVLGLLEFVPWADIEPWLAAFKPMPTTVGGVVRLSGTFEYANGAALYLELALPLLLGLTAVFSSGRLLAGINGPHFTGLARRVAQSALFVLCGVMTMALLLTLSRAAVAGAMVALLFFGLAVVARRSSFVAGGEAAPIVLRSLMVAVAFMALGALYLYVTQPIFRLRLITENDRGWYDVSYKSDPLPALSAREWVTVPLTLRNDGPMLWRAQGALQVHPSYHWLSEDKKQVLVFEGLRTELPHDVDAGQSVTVQAIVQAPPRAGTYYFQWDMVQENVTWFSYKSGIGSEPVKQVIGEPKGTTSASLPKSAVMPRPVEVQSMINSDAVERTKLWRVAFSMFRAHSITGVGPDGFRNLYGAYAGVTSWNHNIYTNNTYIEMFANLGLLGGLAFLWLAGSALWKAVRNIFREPIDGRWAIGLGATAAIIAFSFHSFVDYFLFSTPMYVIFWLMLAIGTLWPQTVPVTEKIIPAGEVVA